MKSEKTRSEKYKRDMNLEKSLSFLNNAIGNTFLSDDFKEFSNRPVFIIGCARSGSTLLFKYLSETGAFNYPTNIIARFYKNPAFGAYVQKVLYDYDNGQIFEKGNETTNYNSDLGKTNGPTAPSEFWYFWREYFQFRETHQLDQKSLDAVNIQEFIQKLTAWESIDNRPLLMKGMILNWHLPYLYKHIPNAIFIYIRRNLLYTAQSILKAREAFYNDRNSWWSFKPAEYLYLKDKMPLEQVAGQVYYTNRAIEEGLTKIPKEAVIRVSYSEFCKAPQEIIQRINYLSKKDLIYSDVPLSFENRNRKNLPDDEFTSLTNYVQKLEKP